MFINQVFEEWRDESKINENQQSKTRERERERERERIRDWNSVTRRLFLRAILYPIVFRIIYWWHRIRYYLLMTPYSIFLKGKESPHNPHYALLQLLTKHAGQKWSICINIAVPARTCFLLILKHHAPNKNELFYGDDKLSRYCLYYRIHILNRQVCDTPHPWSPVHTNDSVGVVFCFAPKRDRLDFLFLRGVLTGCPRGLVVKAMDCGIIVSEFVL